MLDESGEISPRGRTCQGHNQRAQTMINRLKMMIEIHPGHPQWPASGIGAHGTFRQHVAGIKKDGLRAGGVGGASPRKGADGNQALPE